MAEKFLFFMKWLGNIYVIKPWSNQSSSAPIRSGEKNTLGLSKVSMAAFLPAIPQGAVMSQPVNCPSGISTLSSLLTFSGYGGSSNLTVADMTILEHILTCPLGPG